MENKNICKQFIYLASLFGMLFIMLIPPFQSPDEGSHFEKAYVLSKGDFYPEVHDGKQGFYLPEELINYIEDQEKSVGNYNFKQTYADTIKKDKSVGVGIEEKFEQFSTMSANPIGHIIPCIGIIVGKFVSILAGRDPSIVMLLYFARLISLVVYVIGIAYAIKITPVFKRTFCFVGLLPMALLMGSMVSYDGLLIIASFLFASVSFKLIFDDKYKMRKAHILLFALIAYIFFALKIVYLPMFLLLVFIPKEKYEDQRRFRMLAYICCIFLGLIAVSKIPAFFIESVDDSANSLIKEQYSFVIKNPIKYLKIFYNTVKEGRDYYISTTIGVFGHVDTYLYSVFIYPCFIFLIVLGVLDGNIKRLKITWKQRGAIIISILAGVFGVFLAMYTMWTAVIPGGGVGADHINGVQGRYFLPFIPVVFICVSGLGFIRTEKQKKLANIVVDNSVLMTIIILVCSLFTVLLRFWV